MASRRLTLACAFSVALVLVADGAVVAVRARRSSPPAPTAFDGVVAELRGFVERERGLAYLRPVPVRLQSDDDFFASLRNLQRRQRGDADTAVLINVVRALGLLDGPFDASVLDAGAEEGVFGFYDSQRRRLHLRGDADTPAVRRVLVHELTHALDDQHFGLERPNLARREDEAALGFASLVEGDAVRVEERYFESLNPDEQRVADVQADAIGSFDPDLPRVFEVLLAFPYDAGVAFVAALAGAGGPDRINAAFANPPTTSEQILHPERFLGEEAGKEVTAPVADGRVVDRGQLGELGLRLLLQEGLDRSAAARVADGWGADRFVAWSNGEQTCVRGHVVMDTPGDRDELVEGLRAWAARNPGGVVDGADPVTLTRCA